MLVFLLIGVLKPVFLLLHFPNSRSFGLPFFFEHRLGCCRFAQPWFLDKVGQGLFWPTFSLRSLSANPCHHVKLFLPLHPSGQEQQCTSVQPLEYVAFIKAFTFRISFALSSSLKGFTRALLSVVSIKPVSEFLLKRASLVSISSVVIFLLKPNDISFKGETLSNQVSNIQALRYCRVASFSFQFLY